jgi:tetratricopeptide (TPR) repeat protein
VITTRYPGFVQHSTAGSTSVEEMSSTDAVALLERVAGLETQSTDVEGETDGSRITTIEGVVKALGYLALAIIQAGAVIRQKLVPLEGFCSLFSKRKKDLLDLGVPNIDTESQRTVFTTWEISIGMIEAVKEPHAQFALELLNLFAFMHFDGITMIIFERAVQNASEAGASRGTSFRGSSMMRFMPNGWDVILAAKALKVLASYSLVTVDDSYSISIHPLIHQWTRDRLGETQRLEAWKASLLTVAVATHWFWSINILPTRKSMLPHIDSCISYGEDKLFLGGPDVEDRIFAALTFARAYQEDFRGNAIDLSIKALECVQIHKPSGCFYHLSAVDQVARDLATLGRFKQSAEILEEALELKETQESRDIMNKSLLLLLFGEVLSSSGQALKSLEICQNLRKTYLSDLGEGDPTMIQALETIGYAKRQLGKQKDAIMCLQSCLKLRERYHGSNHYLTGFENFRQLAELYYQTRQVKKAVMTQTEYINRLKGSFGGENLQTKLAVSVLGVYKTRNSFLRGKGIMEGIPIAKEALSRETYGETTVPELICMEQLVTYYSVAGAFDKALDLQTEILELCVQKLGESNSVTIQAQKKKQQLQKLLAIRRAIFWWVPRKIYERDWAKV